MHAATKTAAPTAEARLRRVRLALLCDGDKTAADVEHLRRLEARLVAEAGR